jgi:hypothetical protein
LEIERKENSIAKKTLAFVVYQGISLLELVANRTFAGSHYGAQVPLLKLQARYDPVAVGERVEALPMDIPMSLIPQKTFTTLISL